MSSAAGARDAVRSSTGTAISGFVGFAHGAIVARLTSLRPAAVSCGPCGIMLGRLPTLSSWPSAAGLWLQVGLELSAGWAVA